jgi:hypothetical protein
MKSRPIRRTVAIATLALAGFGVAAAPANAAVIGGGGHASGRTSCAIPGLVLYSGQGFTHVRFSTYVSGAGWMTGAWQSFKVGPLGDAVGALAPVPQRGRTFAVLAEYAVRNPVFGTWTIVSEWLPMENGFWCTAR